MEQLDKPRLEKSRTVQEPKGLSSTASEVHLNIYCSKGKIRKKYTQSARSMPGVYMKIANIRISNKYLKYKSILITLSNTSTK